MTRPISQAFIDNELCALVNHGGIMFMGVIEEQLALELAREYARYLMGYREKIPSGQGLTIMQNNLIRSETWLIVKRYGYLRREAPQWQKYLENSGKLTF